VPARCLRLIFVGYPIEKGSLQGAIVFLVSRKDGVNAEITGRAQQTLGESATESAKSGAEKHSLSGKVAGPEALIGPLSRQLIPGSAIPFTCLEVGVLIRLARGSARDLLSDSCEISSLLLSQWRKRGLSQRFWFQLS